MYRLGNDELHKMCKGVKKNMNNLLLACSLGDGHISKDGTFSIIHQAKQ